MRAELERRHDAEVAAAAAQRPEQVGVLLGARVHLRAVGEHDVGADQAVDRQAVAPRQVAEAPAEREPADARGRDDPRRRRAAVLGGRAVDLAPGAAAADADGLGRRVHQDVAQAREVDDDAVVDDPEAAAVVAAAAHGERRVVGAREGDGARDVLGARAADDQRGTPVDHAVVHGAGLVVAWIVRADDGVFEPGQVAAREPRRGRWSECSCVLLVTRSDRSDDTTAPPRACHDRP